MAQARVPAGNSKGGQFTSGGGGGGGKLVPGQKVKVIYNTNEVNLVKKGPKYATIKDKPNPNSIHEKIRNPPAYRIPAKNVLSENKGKGTVNVVGIVSPTTNVIKQGRKFVTLRDDPNPNSIHEKIRNPRPYKVPINRILKD